MSVTPSQIDLISRLLDAASLRHQVIAQNVANVNTPGYHRLDVAFEELLEQELKANGATIEHRQQPRVIEALGGVVREDGNNVDIDVEMGRLNKNTMLYNVYAQILATKIAAMRSAITGR
jgi:flagellar basal-body rod protein FlgB